MINEVVALLFRMNWHEYEYEYYGYSIFTLKHDKLTLHMIYGECNNATEKVENLKYLLDISLTGIAFEHRWTVVSTINVTVGI